MESQDKTKRSMSDPVLTRWWDFIRRNRAILISMLSFAAIPPVIDIIFSVGPPWPHWRGAIAFTSVVGYLVAIIVYVQHFDPKPTEKKLKSLRTYLVRCAIWTGCMMSVYIALRAMFLCDAPTPQYQVSSGLFLQPAVAKLLESKPGMMVRDALESAEWDPERVWIPWTVKLLNYVLLCTWLGFFGCLGALISTFVVFLQAQHEIESSSAAKKGIVRHP